MSATNLFTVEHIGLAAKNTTELKEWYVSVLGGEVVFQMPQEPPAYLICVGGLLLEIYHAAQFSDQVGNNQVGGWRHLALKVNSIEEVRDWLVERGVKFTESIKLAGGGGKVLFFKDPEGNLFHLVERLPGGYQ